MFALKNAKILLTWSAAVLFGIAGTGLSYRAMEANTLTIEEQSSDTEGELYLDLWNAEPEYEKNGDFIIDDKGVLRSYSGEGKNVVVPQEVKALGDYAFSGHSEIKFLILPEGLERIGSYALSGCVSIESLKIPDSVTGIGGLAFAGCMHMKSLYLGDNLESLGRMSVCECGALNNIMVSEDNKVFASCGGVLYDKSFGVLIKCPQGFSGDFTAPKSVHKICEYAFSGCISLTKATFCDSLTHVSEAAFFNCTSLGKVCLGDKVNFIGSCTFADCISLQELTISSSVNTLGSSVFYNCKSLKKVLMHSDDIYIGHQAFYGCDNLVIFGKEGSTADVYAQKNGIEFKKIEA